MTCVKQLGYLAIGVKDLDDAVRYYSRIVRLDQTERLGRTAFMTGGREHHWLRLEEGTADGLKRIGYEVETEADLLAIRDRLQARNVAFTEGGDAKRERVQRWLRFADPGGMDIELYCGMYERGTAPVGAGIQFNKFLHAGWETPHWDETVAFYREVLGFEVSDWIGDTVGFLRAADRYHHSLVLIRSPRKQFNHFCIDVASIDDVMRFRNNALKCGVELRDDLLRHAPSGSIGVYIKDAARGFAVEYCTGHPQLGDEHKPRLLPMTPETADIWRSPLPEIVAASMHEVSTLTGLPQPGSKS